MPAARKMPLVAYLKAGPTASYASAWRYPGAPLDDIWTPERYEGLARALEYAKFDAGFFADSQGVTDIYKNSYDDYLGRGGQMSLIDPMIVLPLMARVTKHLGLASTLSTTFNEPYQLARRIGSLDLISGGRAAWNVVTSATDYEARNHGLQNLPPKEERYDRADEVLEACFALWDCWDEDAVVFDRESGVFVDTSKVRYANYSGRYVQVRGPMTIPRTPQGRPVIMQAGASPRGREFAARWAELVFCSHATKEDAIAYRDDILARVAALGRKPEECRILPSFSVVVGETESIAREKAEYLDSRLDPELVLASSSGLLGVDLSRVETAEQAEAEAGNQGIAGSRDRMSQVAKAQGISFGQAVRKARKLFHGTPKMIADHMEDWFRSGACDGFVLPPTVFPGTYEEFGRMVVPELQRRGIFRREYAGKTLRDNIRNPG
ncbi:LLM class flavin-dependent oxidoreductase [Acidisphaera sp. L21]|uniref:LLM class flavin-dependent oxidoreductase n=1 Tax=Acidisphaera sp. L21 TaxID=1641851 RepID=UPI001C204843|nr:LLM class flavin-dependent oxidoreductase [Acidisphaera sp. L21]